MRKTDKGSRAGRGALLALVLLSAGTLGLSSRSENEIPEPEKNFRALVVDVSQARTEGEQISVEGLTYFSVLRGETTLFIPFEKLRSVEVQGEPRTVDGVDRVEARFTFHDGTTEQGLLKARHLLYGTSKMGNFQLKLRDLRSVEFRNGSGQS